MSLKIDVSEHGLIDLFFNNSPWIRDAQPWLAWRRMGEEKWIETASELVPTSLEEQEDTLFTCNFADAATLRLHIRRCDAQTWELSGELRNTSSTPLELARIHYLHGTMTTNAGLLAPRPLASSCRLFRRGEKLTPAKEQMEANWRSMMVVWPRMADPLHVQADWALSRDTGILTPGWDAPGVHFGFTAPITAFGEVGLHTTAATATCFAGLLLDGVRLDPGQTRQLDTLQVRGGDWQESMCQWVKATAIAAGVTAVRPPPVGYCSWYQYGPAVRSEHIERATREFAAWPIPAGGRTIQIDDGFQIMPGDWRPNARFAETWAELPEKIAASGSLPGLWLAPHAVFHRHPICTEHPDWLQRLPDGTHAISFANWCWCGTGKFESDMSEPTYYLDPDHPGARKFMFDIVADAVRAGWKYLKLDFTYALSTARKPYDPRKTCMETLRSMYELFREAAGPDTIINACIGEMGRYALGLADTTRLGGDIGSDWKSIQNNLPVLLIRWATNGTWWGGDPDVFYMRQERLQMNSEEAWCLTGTIGMLGGVFQTSDFASQWSDKAAELVRVFWNDIGPQVPTDFHVVYSADGVPQAIRFSYPADSAIPVRVVLYNWSDEPATVRLPLAALRLPQPERWKISKTVISAARLEAQCLVINDLPPHSLRIAELS
jgi:hypothetical protein